MVGASLATGHQDPAGPFGTASAGAIFSEPYFSSLIDFSAKKSGALGWGKTPKTGKVRRLELQRPSKTGWNRSFDHFAQERASPNTGKNPKSSIIDEEGSSDVLTHALDELED